MPYSYVDISKSMRNLKAFLKLRDSLPVFEPCKEVGAVGIPAFVLEDGTVTLDWEGCPSSAGRLPRPAASTERAAEHGPAERQTPTLARRRAG